MPSLYQSDWPLLQPTNGALMTQKWVALSTSLEAWRFYLVGFPGLLQATSTSRNNWT